MPLREGTPVTQGDYALVARPISGRHVLGNIRKFHSELEMEPQWVSSSIPGYFEKALAAELFPMSLNYERTIKDTFLYRNEDFFGSYTKETFREHWGMLEDRVFRQQCMDRIAEILDESV